MKKSCDWCWTLPFEKHRSWCTRKEKLDVIPMIFIALFVLIALVGCADKIPLTPSFKPSRESPRHAECTNLSKLGWIENQVDYNACVKHMTNPKFKKAQSLKMIDSSYMPHCRFKVTGLVWAHGYVKNKPYYEGNVICVDKLNHYLQMFQEGNAKAETELRSTK